MMFGVGYAEEPDWYAEPYAARADARVLPGSLLVSSVDLTEPAFRRTVVYVIEHNSTGTLGVILNRPSDMQVRSVLPSWGSLAARPGFLYVGGPVKRDSALCLATIRHGQSADGIEGVRHVNGRVVMVDLDSNPEVVESRVDGVRVFAGYAGWSPGQLAGELARDDWLVFPALPSDVLGPGRSDLWAAVLRRQPLPIAMLATHPIDVDRN